MRRQAGNRMARWIERRIANVPILQSMSYLCPRVRFPAAPRLEIPCGPPFDTIRAQRCAIPGRTDRRLAGHILNRAANAIRMPLGTGFSGGHQQRAIRAKSPHVGPQVGRDPLPTNNAHLAGGCAPDADPPSAAEPAHQPGTAISLARDTDNS